MQKMQDFNKDRDAKVTAVLSQGPAGQIRRTAGQAVRHAQLKWFYNGGGGGFGGSGGGRGGPGAGPGGRGAAGRPGGGAAGRPEKKDDNKDEK